MRPADRVVRAADVFIAGGLPTITYNPRDDLGLERIVRDYLDARHRVLSLSGPTKSGKTVLLHSILDGTDTVWVSGGEVHTYDEFWAAVADQLGIFPAETLTGETTAGSSDGTTTNLRVTPGGIGAEATSEARTTSGLSHGGAQTRERPIIQAAKGALLARHSPVVIDDFHYLDRSLQGLVIRSLKDAVFRGTPVITAAVPHRAYDPVRVEREMTGRVEQLEIPFWSVDELLGVANAGLEALNLCDPDRVAEVLAREAFSSPFLMQDFCLAICRSNGFEGRVDEPRDLEPPDWEQFFSGRASIASKTAFDRLARGPRQRSDRLERTLNNGQVTDIYGVVLAAIAHTGPLTQITYEGLRGALRDVMSSEPPQRHEVTRVLEEMARIAREEIEGEPVVDYDEELSTLHISDPFFAYYLRWAVRNRDAA